MLSYLYRILCGFFLGLSIVAPGLSGSVIAIIMGIYKDLVDIAANPLRNLKRNIAFCIPLVIGAALSAVVFVLLFDFLFETYEKATYLLFLGLIAGNLPVIYAHIKKHGFRWSYLLGAAIAFVAALVLFLTATDVASNPSVEGFTASLPLLATAGFAGGATALIPGMSVSMVLIVFGVYRQLIFAARSLVGLDWSLLVPAIIFALSAVIGVILSSRAIKWIFEELPGLAYTIVFGFMTSSILGLIIQSARLEDAEFSWGLGILMLAVGLIISMAFVYLSNKMDVDHLKDES